MGSNDAKPKTVYVRLPVDLCQEDLKNAAGVGLFYLALGKRPTSIPCSPTITKTRLQLSTKAQGYLLQVVDSFGSQNAAVVAALAFVAQSPKHVRNTII